MPLLRHAVRLGMPIQHHKMPSENCVRVNGLLCTFNSYDWYDFVESKEADVEDMFDVDFYLQLVNGEFKTDLSVDDLPRGYRILGRLEKYFEKNPLPNGVKFNHYRPARYFNENAELLESKISQSSLDRFQTAFNALNDLL